MKSQIAVALLCGWMLPLTVQGQFQFPPLDESRDFCCVEADGAMGTPGSVTGVFPPEGCNPCEDDDKCGGNCLNLDVACASLKETLGGQRDIRVCPTAPAACCEFVLDEDPVPVPEYMGCGLIPNTFFCAAETSQLPPLDESLGYCCSEDDGQGINPRIDGFPPEGCNPCEDEDGCGGTCVNLEFGCAFLQSVLGDPNRDIRVCPTNPAACCDFYSNGAAPTIVPEYMGCGAEPDTVYCAPDGGSGTGDPHFKTMGGSWYDFHGVCDLILLRARGFGMGLGLDIHIRTKSRHGYSFIETAVIRIGDSLLEVSGYGQYMLNGVTSAEMPNTMGGLYEVTHGQMSTKEHVLRIMVGAKKEKILVSTFKDMVSVKIENPSSLNFVTSEGLMGSFPTGELVGRDGTTVFASLDRNDAFGQEWQVYDTDPHLFESERVPQYPQKCILPDNPSLTQEAGRRLGESVNREAAEEACAHWEEEKKRDMCIFDVVAMGDLDLARASGVY